MFKIPKVFTKVRITIDNSYLLGRMCVWHPKTTIIEGSIYPSNAWDKPDSVRLHAVNHTTDYPVIPLKSILGIEQLGVDTSAPVIEDSASDEDNSVNQVYEIKSSKGNSTYKVTKERGRWMCNCVAGLHGRLCKHVKEAQTLEAKAA